MFTSALLKLRNIGILIAVWILLTVLNGPSALPALLGIGRLPDALTFAGDWQFIWALLYRPC